MTKVTIIKEGAKINFVPHEVGKVMEIDDELVSPWLASGLIVVGEVVPNIPEPAKAKKVEK